MKRRMIAALVVGGLLAGCQAVVPKREAAPAAEQMTQAQMEALGVQAEQAIAGADYPQAIALYQRLLRAYPNSAPAWFRLGTVHLRVGEQRQAQYDFEKALQADPNLSKAYANLAMALLKEFRVAAARAIASEQVSEDNRATLRSLMRDVDHALYPPASLPPTVLQ